MELDISITKVSSHESDTTKLSELASMAVCRGFDYVKINEANGAVSVAMKQCKTEEIRCAIKIRTCLFHHNATNSMWQTRAQEEPVYSARSRAPFTLLAVTIILDEGVASSLEEPMYLVLYTTGWPSH